MSLTLVTAPAHEPVTLHDLKTFLRVDHPADDLLLRQLLTSTRRLIDGKDGWLGRALVTQTWELALPGFPRTCDRPEEDSFPGISVPLPPLQAVSTIVYTDPDGAAQTMPAADYLVDSKSEPGRIIPAYGTTWPSTRLIPNAVMVTFIAGYGLPVAVPEDLKTWIKNGAGYFYQQREAGTLPDLFFYSIATYRMWSQ